MKTPFVFVILLFASTILFSQEKTFVREYLYSAGETDSKISARSKALEQVKVLLLEELGTYVESWVNYKVEEIDKIDKDFFEQEIKTISAGITETKILDENWNGYEYFIKAEITADPEEVVRRINQTLSARRSSEVIDSLKLLLSSSVQEIAIQSRELEKIKAQLELQNREVKSKQETLSYLNQQLNKAKQQLSTYQAQENQILTQIESIEKKINNATTKAVTNVRIGMTPNEVKQVCGNPRSTDDCTGLNYNYGSVWVMFESGIVKAVVNSKDFRRCASVYHHKMFKANFIKL
jgi:small-conductance mechanosensitive channel